MLARSKSGICGKKQIKPNMRERKRNPKVVSFRRWFLEIFLIKTLMPSKHANQQNIKKIEIISKILKSNHNTHIQITTK